MDLIIAGTRTFNNYSLLKNTVSLFLENYPTEESITIISGGCRGADMLGEKWAKENEHEIIQFLPNWDLYGKAAGPKRNEEMAKNATHCLIFWDGRSKGTMSMIALAKKYKLSYKIVKYKE